VRVAGKIFVNGRRDGAKAEAARQRLQSRAIFAAGTALRLLAILAALFAAAQPATAAQRVALVIGNGKYVNAGTLANPVNDAGDMAAALKDVGFTVVAGYDLDKPALEKKIREFAVALSGAETGVFFYAGHGLQVAGANYIVPVDAELSTPDALEFEMVKLDSVQRIMENAAKTNILFLDACRNNPLARNLARALGTRGSAIGVGLAPAESGVGTLISFSTQPGNVAQDGKGRNSPFTGPLVKRIAAPGQDILTVLTEVRNEVLAATADKQVPWENHALRAKFYFNPSAAPPPPAQAPLSEAALAWSEVRESKDAQVLEAFRKQYGAANPLYDTLAAQRIAALKQPGAPASPWWSWGSGQKTEPEQAKPPEQQTAVVVPPPAPSPEPACDGLLVSVAAGKKPCIKPGSGDSFKDCADCPEMVVVPKGSFSMGSPSGEDGRYDDEGPQHEVTIGKPFAVGKFVVTFDEWDACVSGGGCKGNSSPGDEGWGRGRRPVINVNRDDAQEYVKWLSRKTGKNYRLLSEAEWEYAARAGTRTRYFWGDSVGRNNANCDGCGSEWDNKKTAEVGQFQPNAFGLYDMAGNVWQRTDDCWNGNYNGAPNDGAAMTTGDCSQRVLRGGSWANAPRILRAAARFWDDWYGFRFRSFGFRVARTF
jgi:formylglycine-generating enzyme required for sulfatase activity